MRRRIIFTGLGLALAAGAVAAPHSKKSAPAAAPNAQAKELLENCDAHKFETVVKEVVDGQPHQSKVKLCGKEGQSDVDWIGTLKDAVSKVGSNKQMPAAVRDQIVAALSAEINRLEHPEPLLPRQSTAKNSVLDKLSPMPPIPQVRGGQVASALPPPRAPTAAAPPTDYAALPPLPTTPPPPVHVLPGGAGGIASMLAKPRMTLTCYTPGETPDGPCTGFTRDTMVTVHAGEDLPANTSLRFVRDGDAQADVELAQLKKGRSMSLAVPTDVCRHVVGGKLELRIVRAGQEVASDGPYNLNC